MTATLLQPSSSPAHAPPPAPAPRRTLRRRIARLERPLLAGGLALVAAHLHDVALSGPDPSGTAIWAILAIPVAWVLLQPRMIRPTRLLAAVVTGLLTFGFGVVSHGLHVVNSGPDWRDVTGVGMAVGGLLLVASGLAAVAAPRRAPRRRAIGWRAAHGAGWALGAFVGVAILAQGFLYNGLLVTHAPRWEIQEASLGIPHDEVTIEMEDGRDLSAWYVPSRNRTAVVLSHGSGGSRERVVEEARMLARHGYGVLAFDNPGNGESEGHSNGLGGNAQPAVDAALDWLSQRPDVDPDRIAGFGSSLGGEVLLEAAARDERLRAVVSDGSARPQDAVDAQDIGFLGKAMNVAGLQMVRGLSGMHVSPSLNGLIGEIAPRPVLLIAAGTHPDEVAANEVYQERGGPTVRLWEIPEAGHTGGLKARPAEYEQRTTAFLDRALGL
jgi:pimeloyl-ACP methyl ester carboxylesterase